MKTRNVLCVLVAAGMFLLSALPRVASAQIVMSSGIRISNASTNTENQSVTMEIRARPTGVLQDSGTITVFPGQTAATTATNLVAAITNPPNAAGKTITNPEAGGIVVTSTEKKFETRFCAGNGPCGAGDVIPPAKVIHGQTYDKNVSQVPTVSEWGLMVLTLLVLTGLTIVVGRRRRSAPA